jgi:hypothetical protein
MGRLEFKKSRENFEINLFEGKNSSSHYRNIVTRDPQRIAQILIDLYLYDFPVERAIKIFLKRIRSQDWLGI